MKYKKNISTTRFSLMINSTSRDRGIISLSNEVDCARIGSAISEMLSCQNTE